MAIKWGSAITTSTNGVRLGYEFTQSPSTVGSSTSSVTVTLRLYVGTRRAVYDSSNSWSLSGNFSGSGNVAISHSNNSTDWSSQNVTLIATRSITVTPSYSGATTVSFSASLSGVNAVSGTARVSGSHTVGQRPISAPLAPTNVSTSRVSDSQTRVTWSRQSPTSASRPYQSQHIDRRNFQPDGTWTSWSRRATLSASATSYTDSTVGNWRYQYRVRANNTGGNSAWTTSPVIETTPAAPTNVKVTPTATGNRVTWSRGARYPTYTEIQRQENGGTWVTVDTFGHNTFEWTHSDPNVAVTHRYRLRHVSNSPTLYSDWTYTSTVQLAAPPGPPTLANLGTQDADLTTTLRWTHAPVDGSEQQAYEVQHRRWGTTTWTSTGKRSSSLESWVMPAGTYREQTVQWRVRTWGVHSDPGPWSTIGQFYVSERPTVTINTPAAEVSTSRLTVEWGYGQAGDLPQGAWEAALANSAGVVMETRSGPGEESRTTFRAVLADGSRWTVRVRVRSSVGLWSEWEVQPFEVHYPLPPSPGVTALWDEDLAAAQVHIDNPAAGDGFVYTNLVPNPSFETNTSGLVVDSWAGLTVQRVAATTAAGGYALRIINSGSLLRYVWQEISVTEADVGRRLGFSLRVRSDDASTVRLSVRQETSLQTPRTPTSLPLSDADAVAEPALYQVSAPGVVRVGLAVSGGTTVETDAWVAVLADDEDEARETALIYFDGDSPAESHQYGDEITHAWTGTLHASPSTRTLPATVDATYNNVYRRIDGGEWVLIAREVPLGTAITDPIPHLTRPTHYRAEAVAVVDPAHPDATSSMFSPAGHLPGAPRSILGGRIYLNGGPHFSDVARLRGQARLRTTAGREKVLHQFAGRTRPVEFSGEARSRTLSLSGRIGPDTASVEDIEALAVSGGPICYRDALGRRLFVSLADVDASHERITQDVSLTMTEVDHDEHGGPL